MSVSHLIDFNYEEFQRRVRKRLDEINEKPTPLALRHGLGRDFIRDIVSKNARKRSVRASALAKLARALDCDEEYLTMRQPFPRRKISSEENPTQEVRGRAEFGGICEPGVWRSTTSKERPSVLIPAVFSPALGDDAVAYIQRGNSLSKIGVFDGMILYAKRLAQSMPGDLVVIRRTTKIGLYELTARIKSQDGTKYEFAPADEADGGDDVVPDSMVKITEEAVVKIAQRIF